MKRLELKRISISREVTQGVLVDVATGLPIMLTLELPDEGNARRISCIPKGIYAVVPYSSEKYKSSFSLVSVPGRTSILIHAGNTVKDIDGCILVGNSFGILNNLPAVLNSRHSLKSLISYVDKKPFELVIS